MMISSSCSSITTLSNNNNNNNTKSNNVMATSSFRTNPGHTTTTTTATNTMPTRWVFLRYTGMILLALLAGSMDWKMQRQLQAMSFCIQSALRVATFDLMEHVEEYKLQQEVNEEELEVKALENKVEYLEDEATAEQEFAGTSRMRGDYLLKMAQMEQYDAEQLMLEAQRSAELREKVLANLTLEEAEQKQTLDRIRTVHQGMCSWSFVNVLCDTVGGVTGLQHKSDAETLMIQTEWREANALQRQERLQEMVAQMLQGEADQYNKTAQYLQHVADLWDDNAQKAFELAHHVNETAEVLELDVEVKEAEVQHDQVVEKAAETEIHNLLHTSQIYHVRAYWCALVALVSGMCALVYFVCTAAPRFLAWLEPHPAEFSSVHSAQLQADAVWQNLSYLVIHAFFFLTVVGMTGYYVWHMPQYELGQRAVIVIWFACLGSSFQTFFLHAIPQFLMEVHAQVPDLPGFALQVAVKACVIFFIYLMEILFVYLAMGQAIFAPAVVSVFNTLGFCLFTVGLAVFHVYYFDTHWGQNSGNESITVWQCADDDQSAIRSQTEKSIRSAVSELTPLRKAEVSSVGTIVELPSGSNKEDHQTSSLLSFAPSQRTTNWLRDEFSQLLLPFELLVIASMVAIMRSCLHTIWNSQATGLQCAVLACAVILLLWGAVLVKDLTCEECYEVGQGRQRRAKKRLDALELVQV